MNNKNLLTVLIVLCILIAPLAVVQAENWTLQGSNIYNNNAGNVGIGTTGPSSLLEVNGTATIPQITGGTNAASTLTLQSTSGNGAAGAAILFKVGNNGNKTSIRVFNNGHVSINNSVDIGNFYVSADTAGTQLLFDYNGSGDSYIDTTNTLHLRTTASFTERITLLSSGNVGIGTTTPTQTLDVVGNFKLSGSIVSDGDICIGT